MDDILQMIYEGMYDPCTYKAIFIVGGPGSGKTWVTKKLGLVPMGFVSLDSDYPLEKYMKKANLSLKMPESEREKRTEIRKKATDVIDTKENVILNQGLGVVIGGTGSKIPTIIDTNNKLKSYGYETSMIFVNTDMETALARNASRERSVPENIVVEKWKNAQKNLGYFQNKFDPFFIIDNSKDSNVDIQLTNIYKKITKWCKNRQHDMKTYNVMNQWQ